VLRTTEDAVNMLPASTHLTASTAPVIMDSPVMALPAHVRHIFYRILRVHELPAAHLFFKVPLIGFMLFILT